VGHGFTPVHQVEHVAGLVFLIGYSPSVLATAVIALVALPQPA
jgi:hypothetical protein